MSYLKVKAEIFKLSSLGKLACQADEHQNKPTKKVSSKIKNDEIGYFSSLEGL